MNIEAVRRRYPLPSEHFNPFLRKEVTPVLDVVRLEVQLLAGGERDTLRTPTTGNISHVLRYKGHEGAVSSFENTQEEDLILVQLQGSR